MELGNAIFGHSRGNYEVDREKYQYIFHEYLEAMGFDTYGHHEKAGGDGRFDNGIFSVFPYYWGDCTCGYDKLEEEWSKQNQHDPTCYQIEYHKLPDDDPDDKHLKALLEKWKLPMAGCAIHCTCTHEKRWIAWREKHDHTSECPFTWVNFHYKPTNLIIEWYKYPLRDSYSNRPFTTKELVDILEHCKQSAGVEV